MRIRVGCVVNDNKGDLSVRRSILKLYSGVGSTPPGLCTLLSSAFPLLRLVCECSLRRLQCSCPPPCSPAPAAAGKQRRCQHTGCELPERQCLVSSLYPQPSTFPSCQWSVLWVLPCVTRPSCLIPTVRCLQQLICPESAIYSQDPGQMCTYYYENTKK